MRGVSDVFVTSQQHGRHTPALCCRSCGLTARAYFEKLAFAVLFALIVTVQVVFVPAARHASVQPRNCLPAAGTAVSVTTVPDANLAEQSLPQLMAFVAGGSTGDAARVVRAHRQREGRRGRAAATGVAATADRPPPPPDTFGISAKVAVTLVAAFTGTEQVVLVPAQAPFQPEKVKPLAGFAVSVTIVPAL